MLERVLERLTAAGIEPVPVDLKAHYVFARGVFIALVERRDDGFGAVGAAGLLSEKGLAPLLWRGDRAFFVAKDFEREAMPAEVDDLRNFQSDLEAALRS
jgi:hypothetical protein